MNLVFAIDFSHVLLTLLSETVHSVEIHTTKLTGLGITDSAMRAILGILDAFIFNCTERYDDSVALFISVDLRLSHQLYIRSVHQAEHRDDGNVPEDLQYNRTLDPGGCAGRAGLRETGSIGIGRRHPHHCRVLQHRRFLRSQHQSHGPQSELRWPTHGIHEYYRVHMRHPRAADRRGDHQGFGS